MTFNKLSSRIKKDLGSLRASNAVIVGCADLNLSTASVVSHAPSFEK
jgi:hypothetical protein